MIKYLTNLIKAYKYTVTPYSRGIFLPKIKRIRIEDFTNETFAQIFDILTKALGEPVYTHSFYGHLWKMNGKVIAYCTIEEQYNYVSLNVLILNAMPVIHKIPYTEYLQIDTTVKSFTDKQSLICDNCINYCYPDKFNYLFYNNAKQLLLIIGNKTIKYYLSVFKREEIGSCQIPKNHGTKNINRKDIDSLSKALNEIFDELGTI